MIGLAFDLQAQVPARRARMPVDGNRDTRVSHDVLYVLGLKHGDEEQHQFVVESELNRTGPRSIRSDSGQRHDLCSVQGFSRPGIQVFVERRSAASGSHSI